MKDNRNLKSLTCLLLITGSRVSLKNRLEWKVEQMSSKDFQLSFASTDLASEGWQVKQMEPADFLLSPALNEMFCDQPGKFNLRNANKVLKSHRSLNYH